MTIVVVIAVAVVVFVVVCGYCSRCRFGLFFCVVLLHAGLNDGDDDLGHRRGSKLAAAMGWIGGCHRDFVFRGTMQAETLIMTARLLDGFCGVVAGDSQRQPFGADPHQRALLER